MLLRIVGTVIITVKISQPKHYPPPNRTHVQVKYNPTAVLKS
jgi:hypothetical protein